MSDQDQNMNARKRLPENFIKDGTSYQQIKRENNFAVYQLTHADSGLVEFETIKIGGHSGYTLGDQYTEPSETYPGRALWGMVGWTFPSLKDALKKLNELVILENNDSK